VKTVVKGNREKKLGYSENEGCDRRNEEGIRVFGQERTIIRKKR